MIAALRRQEGLVAARVGIGDMKTSRDPQTVLETIGLGSCVGIAAWCPKTGLGGMLHYMLPLSSLNPKRAKESPATFADTGVPLLFRELYALGAKKEDLIIKIAGGASLNGAMEMFAVGKRNLSTLKKMFDQNGFRVAAHDVGGNRSRTMRLWLGDGRVHISSPGHEGEL